MNASSATGPGDPGFPLLTGSNGMDIFWAAEGFKSEKKESHIPTRLQLVLRAPRARRQRHGHRRRIPAGLEATEGGTLARAPD